MNIPPSINFSGNKDKAISLKSQAIKFYNYIANQAEGIGVGYVSRILPLQDGSTITVISYKDNNYGNRFGSIDIFGSGVVTSSIIQLGERIVVFPVSDTFPDGWVPLPKASLVYGSDGKRKKLLRHTPTTIDGGNCYWRGTSKDMLTFEGPWGFQVAPAVLKTSEIAYATWHIEGYLADRVGFDSAGDVTAVWPPSFSLVTYSRFYTTIWKDGIIFATSTYNILGCGISKNKLIIVVNIDLTKDRILTADIPTSGVITSWTTLGDINYPSVPGLTYLYRSDIYSFSKDGTKIITLVNCYRDRSRVSKSIVRINLEYDISNNIYISSQSLTPETGISYDFISDGYTNSERTYVHQYSILGLVGEIIIAVGFSGNTESILKLKAGTNTINYEKYETVPPPIHPTIYRYTTWNVKYNLDFYLNNIKKEGMSIIYNNPSYFIDDSVWDIGGYGSLTTTKDYLQYHSLSTITISFLDINSNIFCYLSQDYILNDHWTLNAYSFEATYYSNYLRNLNISLTTKNKDKNKITTDIAPPYIYSSTVQEATVPSVPVAYIPTLLQLPTTNPSQTYYIDVDPRQRTIQPNNYLRPSYDTGNATLAGSPICKGVADKYKNFVGQHRYQYVSEIVVPVTTPPTQIPFIYLEKNVSSLPNKENPVILFDMSGTNPTIAGSRYRTDDRERKIFITTVPT